MRSDRHFRLRALGGLSLELCGVDMAVPVEMRPQPLAVLTVLALSERRPRRDALAAMFWGDQPDARARHSLSTALSTLRAALGPTAITARRADIELSPELRLAVDAVEFRAACEARDDERAAALYTGPLLDDVVVHDAPDFDLWLSRERGRLAHAFVDVCNRHVPVLLDRGDWPAAADLAMRWLEAAPSSTTAFLALLRARSAPATPAALRAALVDYDALKLRLETEYGLSADPAVHAMARQISTELTALEKIETIPFSPTIDSRAPDVPPNTERSNRRSRWWSRVAGIAALAVTTVGIALLRNSRPTTSTSTRPTVAVVQIENLRADTSLAWMQQGLPQLITDALSQGTILDPVAPVRVRDVLARRARPASILSEPDVIDVARRVGASWAVRGGLTAGGGVYVLDIEARSVSTGAEVASFSVSSRDPVRLGELAAGRLLQVATASANSSDATPRFAAGSANPEAYRHFVLGLRAAEEHRSPEDEREMDAAIALDSGFVDAAVARRDMAVARDEPVSARLDSLIVRHADRLSEWNRLVAETYRALYAGSADRAEALAANLVQRFPSDPRAYAIRAEVLTTHGRALAADSVYERALALDSLAIAAGEGPCAPCTAYVGLVGTRLFHDDIAGAERAARHWAQLQPTVPAAWSMVSTALAYTGRVDEAVEAAQRAAALSRDAERLTELGRVFIVARRFASADSIAKLLRGFGREGVDAATDLEATLAREQGDFARATKLLATTKVLELVQADNLTRLGRIHDAVRVYEALGHSSAPRNSAQLSAEQARGFAWAHALEADALWRSGDTTSLQALADSVRLIGARSYYGRDWGLYHHIAGLLAIARGDSARAERELLASRWGVAGWTESLLIVAQLRIARGDGRGAVAILRDAYKGPLDAMGRYVPHSELDAWMARAFTRAGQLDSARVYNERVAQALHSASAAARTLSH